MKDNQHDWAKRPSQPRPFDPISLGDTVEYVLACADGLVWRCPYRECPPSSHDHRSVPVAWLAWSDLRKMWVLMWAIQPLE